jgi:hypothetical protein
MTLCDELYAALAQDYPAPHKCFEITDYLVSSAMPSLPMGAERMTKSMRRKFFCDPETEARKPAMQARYATARKPSRRARRILCASAGPDQAAERAGGAARSANGLHRGKIEQNGTCK